MKQVKIDKNNANQRVDKFLFKYLPNAPKNFVYKLLRKKDVKVNGKRVNENYILQLGDDVSIFLYEDKFLEFARKKDIRDLKITFDILYEDENILVVCKPSNLLVHEDNDKEFNNLTNQVLCYLRDQGEYHDTLENTFTPGPVHRLDRNTSGIVIFGKTLMALQNLNEMMKQRHCIDKTYLTIVAGKIDHDLSLEDHVVKDEALGKMRISKNGLTMKTLVHPLISKDDFSLVEVKLITGRTHQIRVHMASINHPVIGDSKYGDFELNKMIDREYHLNHQFLHAHKIKFVKPLGGLSYLQDVEIICPLPKKLSQIKQKIFN